MSAENIKFLTLILTELNIDLDQCHLAKDKSRVYFNLEFKSLYLYDLVIMIEESTLVFCRNPGTTKHYYLDLTNPHSDPVSWVRNRALESKGGWPHKIVDILGHVYDHGI